MRLRTLALVVFAVAAPPVLARSEEGFTAEDLIALPVVGEMAWSPTTDVLAFTVQRADAESDRDVTTLWFADFRGDPVSIVPARCPGDGVWNLRWSPEGKGLAFLSWERLDDVDVEEEEFGEAQVHLVSPDLGEARPVTGFAMGVEEFDWDRRGKLVLVSAGADDAEDPVPSGGHPGVEDPEAGWYESNETWPLSLYRMAPGAEEPERVMATLPPVLGNLLCDRAGDFAWMISGTGNWHFRSVKEVELHRIPLDGGAPVRVTTNSLSESDPVALSGGGVLVQTGGGLGPRGHQRSGATGLSVAGAGKVGEDGLRPLVDGETRDYLSMDGTRTVDLLPDGKTALALGIRGHARRVVRIDLASGAVSEPKAPAMEVESLAVSPKDGRVALLLSSATEFPEIWVAPSAEKLDEAKPVTELHRHLRGRRRPAVERVSWKAPDGLEIEGILVSPPESTKTARLPLVLAPHGGPYVADIESISTFADVTAPALLFAEQGWHTLYVNYRGSIGRGDAFVRAMEGAPFTGPVGDILAGLDRLVADGRVDPKRVMVTGYSYGGALANGLVVSGRAFAAAVSGAGISNDVSYHGQSDNWFLTDARYGGTPWEDPEAYVRESPVFHADRCRTPTLFIHGTGDLRVPEGQSFEMYRALQRCGVETEFLHLGGEDHDLGFVSSRVAYIGEVMAWFRKHLPAK